MANSILEPKQQQELQKLIQDWLAKNPDSRSTGYIPFPEFAWEAGSYPPSRGAQPGSIFRFKLRRLRRGVDMSRPHRLRKATSAKEHSAELRVCWVLICNLMPDTTGGRPVLP